MIGQCCKNSFIALSGMLFNLWAISGQAALLNLPMAPIGSGNAYPPNVMILLDLSGSMGSYTGPSSMSVFKNNNANVSGLLNYYGYGVATPGTDMMGRTLYFLVPDSARKDWRMNALPYNELSYNPDLNYLPWPGNCTRGTPCQNASFANLMAIGKNAVYNVWIDNKGFTGSAPNFAPTNNMTNTPNGIMDLSDSYITITLGTPFAPTTVSISSTDTVVGPTNKKICEEGGVKCYTGQPLLSTTTTQSGPSGTACFNILGTNALVQQIYKGALSYNSTDAPGCRTIAQAQQNWANWYTYNGTRANAAKSAIINIFAQNYNILFGLTTLSGTDGGMSLPASATTGAFIPISPYSSTSITSNNQNILNTLLPLGTSGSSPIRNTLDNVGLYYSGAFPGYASPILGSCQQNYVVMFTDGAWNNDNLVKGAVGDIDKDGSYTTLADIARYWYNNPTVKMTVYGIAFDNPVLAVGPDGWPTPPLTMNSPAWTPAATDGRSGSISNACTSDLFTSCGEHPDDMWHASFNTNGLFFLDGMDPVKMQAAFQAITQNILSRASGTATSVSQNATTFGTNSQIFQSSYNSINWTGDVKAFPLSSTGINTTPLFSANCMLTGGTCSSPAGTNTAPTPNNRVIITRNWDGTNTGMAFTWPSSYTTYSVGGNLPANLRSFLQSPPSPYPPTTTTSSQITANNAYGNALLNYLRGDRTYETTGGAYTFRPRASLLGDIVDSSPIYITPPNKVYPDTLEAQPYSSFKSTYSNRIPMLFVGANDGMLHGFNANTGAEILAYIPGAREIYNHLPALSQKSYGHYFFVNTTPTSGDVFFNNNWHSIVAFTLGYGGQSLSILDVTDPANFTEAKASSIYLSEFNDQNDPDFGNVPGTPIIAKVRTGANQSKWAIIVNNGYNSTQADGSASTTGKPALFILMLESGINGGWTLNTTYYKILVGTGSTTTPNGLATPFAVDTNGDYIVDYVYAGDQQGNMWRFDLTSTSPSSWTGTLLFNAKYTTAGDQPITAAPIVTVGPTGINNGVMVYFGTGQLLQNADYTQTSQVTQSFYGIWDQFSSTAVTKSQLVQQTILGTGTQSNNTYRLASNNPVNYATGSGQNRGWYINLTGTSNLGERVISSPIVRYHNLVFSTFIPPADPCTQSPISWLMELNALTGGAPTVTPFDTNNDGLFNSADNITINTSSGTVTAPAAGYQSTVGAFGTPTVFVSPDKKTELKVLNGSNGLGTVRENGGASGGRQNWRQLF